jgi:hypothetical protein
MKASEHQLDGAGAKSLQSRPALTKFTILFNHPGDAPIFRYTIGAGSNFFVPAGSIGERERLLATSFEATV